MIHAQKESTQKPTSIARTTRHQILGTIAFFVFSAANGGTASASSSPDHCNQPSITETHHLIANQNSYDLYLKIILDAIIQVLDEILETQLASPVPLNQNSRLTLNLNQSASNLITDYPLLGLAPTLTSSEISGGLVDCSTAMPNARISAK